MAITRRKLMAGLAAGVGVASAQESTAAGAGMASAKDRTAHGP